MNPNYEFIAWSLYTGPSYLNPAIKDPNCSWVTGLWTGANTDYSVAEIKKDIDIRINCLISVFKQALPLYKTNYRCFAIPEFFFRCRQGPYPNIKIDGYYPMDYIVDRISQKFFEIIKPDTENYYRIIIGSVLTSNISDYKTFLSSDTVKERNIELNKILASQTSQSASEETKRHVRWKRELVMEKTYADSSGLVSELLDTFMSKCRANPLCVVRNRGVFMDKVPDPRIGMTVSIYEKQYESTVDLTMGINNGNNTIIPGGMITEWMANYPSYSILKGDKYNGPNSLYARISPIDKKNVDIGIEVCLDHRLQRLRRTVDMKKENGASVDNCPICMQVIPSGGMQILDYAVAADKSMPIFNADGCEGIYEVYGDENTIILNKEAGENKGIVCGVYALNVQSKWSGKNDKKTYYSHSQLAFSMFDSKIDGFNNALGINNQKATTYKHENNQISNPLLDMYKTKIVKITSIDTQVSDIFEAGAGELHIFTPNSAND